ncbi:response regulator transcription factor [Candidatus Odyssella thessalonicensis]|uniref:response regulator transcription factor n=1 Tax=Candidatus Odyssella thessalonicensis TaxID=84647 RepID=UPI000225C1BC|nr:response regulator [Candidatus Odyssella thessalonicensis]
MNSLLCCYFPTKVIFVDDNSSILKSLALIIDHNLATYDFFDNPYQALEFANNCQAIDFLPSAFPMREHKTDEIYKAIFSFQRYEEVSTVIVDYEMPSMKGLEFCEKLQNPYIRKILYTGVADEKIAIEAFNTGLIDGYIRKQDENEKQASILNKFIAQSQLKYFKAITDISLEALIKKDIVYEDHRESPLYDQSFIQYFKELVEKNHITEYYFNQDTGGFVFLTAKGKVSALYVLSNEFFDDVQSGYIMTLEQEVSQDKELSSLRSALDENLKTLCFPFHGNNKHPDVNNWDKYAYPIQVVQGKNRYFVAYVPDVDYISASEVFSFNRYQRKR